MARVPVDDRRAIVASLADAVDRRDVAATVACLSPDVVVEVPRWGGPWRGRDAAAAALGELFAVCEQTRCVVRESQVGSGEVNDQVIFAAKSSRAANAEWMVTTATSTAVVSDGLIGRLTVDVDTDALLSQWRGVGLAAASVRSEVALAGFDPDAHVVTDVRAIEPVSHRVREPHRSRRPVWLAAAAVVVLGTGAAVLATANGRPTAQAPSPSATSTPSPSPTVTDTPSSSPPAPLGPSAVAVSGGGVSARVSGTVLFERDSAVLLPRARAVIVGLADTLRETKGGSLTVLGYTDNLGSAALGVQLSLARAKAVATVFRQELTATGIAITAIGRGEANPVAPNDTEANRAKNRRVEIVYKPAP